MRPWPGGDQNAQGADPGVAAPRMERPSCAARDRHLADRGGILDHAAGPHPSATVRGVPRLGRRARARRRAGAGGPTSSGCCGTARQTRPGSTPPRATTACLDALRRPEVYSLVARDATGRALATGAVVHQGDWAEVKRMWVRGGAGPRAGQGDVGRAGRQGADGGRQGVPSGDGRGQPCRPGPLREGWLRAPGPVCRLQAGPAQHVHGKAPLG